MPVVVALGGKVFGCGINFPCACLLYCSQLTVFGENLEGYGDLQHFLILQHLSDDQEILIGERCLLLGSSASWHFV